MTTAILYATVTKMTDSLLPNKNSACASIASTFLSLLMVSYLSINNKTVFWKGGVLK